MRWTPVLAGIAASLFLLRRPPASAGRPSAEKPSSPPSSSPPATGGPHPVSYGSPGYYGRRFRSTPPPGWPVHVGTRRAEEYRTIFDLVYPAYADRAVSELARMGVPRHVIEQAEYFAMPTIYRLGLHESDGQFYLPANTFNDLPAEERARMPGSPERVSASGAWQFNQGALERLTRDFTVRGQLVHGPILRPEEALRTVHHGSVEAQFIPITHYVTLAAWAIRNGLDPVHAILIMHSGPGHLSNWAAGSPSAHTLARMPRYVQEAEIVRRFRQTGDFSVLNAPVR